MDDDDICLFHDWEGEEVEEKGMRKKKRKKKTMKRRRRRNTMIHTWKRPREKALFIHAKPLLVIIVNEPVETFREEMEGGRWREEKKKKREKKLD